MKLGDIFVNENMSINDDMITGGDWNSIFQNGLDKKGGKQESSNLAPKELLNIIKTLSY